MAAGGGMSVLRLVDRPVSSEAGAGGRSVTVSWLASGFAQWSLTVPVTVSVEDGLAELVRWYLEEYAEFPSDPAPARAVRAETALADLGRRLFQAVFGTGPAARIWGQVLSAGLDRVRVEVDTDPADVPGLPWELLRDPHGDRALVLAAGQFVRTHHETSTPVPVPDPVRDRLRVLLVICRPGGREDVPFRSVASRLIRGGAEQLSWLELEVLRPATFTRLGEVLRAARDEGRPYHVVHFDGHGDYLDTSRLAEDEPDEDTAGVVVSALRYGVSLAGPQRSGRHGYLLFEDSRAGSNQQLVDGPTLARLLVQNRVPVLVLNACRSAYAEPQDAPAGSDSEDGESVHGRIRAYGSLAAEVADAGMAGVVAMRYNVYVVTAAQFVADLYIQLGAGKTLGQAATRARQQLADDPTRHIGDTPVALQDWVVPTVYESAPLTLLAAAKPEAARLRLDEFTRPDSRKVAVPGPPDAGFFGRDETLLALDRAFDTGRVVLLHALAGAGKTTTVAEFARWYATTGGLGAGLVLWTSFEHHTSLDRLLDTVGAAFGDRLEKSGVHWAALTDPAQRREVAVQELARVPVLWIWDNIEPVAGFPDGAQSAWTVAEQDELIAFLRELKSRTIVKVLLTSRRNEQKWLGLLPVRIQLPPMPMAERLQLVRAIAVHLGHPASSDVDWRPLMRFTGGNPLTITVAVRQALREDAAGSTGALTAFVERVTAGRTRLEDPEDVALGRSGSLAASLDYGFATAFTETERAILAVLHLFRDTVDVNTLQLMGMPEIAAPDEVPALAGLTSNAAVALLNRAADIGLLTHYASSYYGIHPALPWYFHTLHTRHVGPEGSSAAHAAARAYTRAVGELSLHYFDQVEDGNTDYLIVLRIEESNLLHAVDLARHHDLPRPELKALMAIDRLYDSTGRNTEWARLLEQVLPDYLAPDGRVRRGREDYYGAITQWRIRIARDRRDLAGAIEMQTALTTWTRERARPHLDTPAPDLDAESRHLLRDLAVSEQGVGRLLYEQGAFAASLPHFQSEYDIFERIGDTVGQAIAASLLGNAYSQMGELDKAQHWHQRDLALKSDENRIGRAAAHGSLANVAYQRFEAAQDAGAPESELVVHLNTVISGHQQALELLPPDHHEFRYVAHNQLGNLNARIGDVRAALRHYQKAVQHAEARGDTFKAANTRYNIALLLDSAGRPADALDYARAAHANYLALGPSTATDARGTAALIREIQRQLDGDE